MAAGGVERNRDYSVEGRKRILDHWIGLLDRAMAFIAGLAMYNWGLRVSEAAKTTSGKIMLAGSKGWEKCLDNHAMTASDVYIAF